jgi:hypothetical protein
LLRFALWLSLPLLHHLFVFHITVFVSAEDGVHVHELLAVLFLLCGHTRTITFIARFVSRKRKLFFSVDIKRS